MTGASRRSDAVPAEDGSSTDLPVDSIVEAIGRARTALAAAAVRAAGLDASTRHAIAGIREGVKDRQRVAQREIEVHLREQKDRIEASARTAIRQARAGLLAVVHDLAPGAAGAEWSAAFWGDPTLSDRPPAALRIGVVDGNPVPALLPFEGVAGWRVGGTKSRELIADAVLRLVLACPPGTVRLTVHDPVLRGTLGFTALLRDVFPQHFPPAVTDLDGFAQELRRLSAGIAVTAEAMNVEGVRQFADLPTGSRGPIEVVVVLDAPHGLDRSAAGALERLVGNCAGRGVFLLVDTPDDHTGPIRLGDVVLDVGQHLVTVRADDRSITSDALPARTFVSDRPLPAGRRNNAVAAWCAAVSDRENRGSTLQALFEETRPRWSDRGEDGVVAAIGRCSTGLLAIELRGANPPAPNALIGGATGSGKSNLLLALVYGLAAAYGPRDLQFYILDFKEGIEFAQLAPRDSEDWLPHVAVLGLESDREYGLAVLRHLSAEFERRAALFKDTGCASIQNYRATTGADMPRLVLIADEFQVLFEPDDAVAQQGVQLLEHLARKGRAYGIHLVLASQTLSGIQALGVKREAIFSQFHNRISLRNTVAESESILGFGNTAAADLTGRGRVVVNADLGHPAGNVEGSVVWADPRYLAELRGELFARAAAAGTTPERPRTFVSSDFAVWRPSDGSTMALGLPVEVDTTPSGFALGPGATANVAVAIADEETSHAVVAAAVASLLAHVEYAACRWTVVSTSVRTLADRRLWDAVAGRGHDVEYVGPDSSREFLMSLSTRYSEYRSTIEHIVVVDDLTDIPGFEAQDPESYVRPVDVVGDFARQSVNHGVLFVSRWRTVTGFLGLGSGTVRSAFSRVVTGARPDDAARVHHEIRIGDTTGPRIVAYDGERGDWRVLVPFGERSILAEVSP